MAIETIIFYRFIPGKGSYVTTYGAPEEQTVAIYNSKTISVSLNFTTKNTLLPKKGRGQKGEGKKVSFDTKISPLFSAIRFKAPEFN
ncbi:hypothetical protein SD81_037595 [Tolypothrix campylonemoides VB511288]|nr:hypothetical protein SD81_037595 [Tolypothrix campylonemoides VB511288]